CRRRTLGGRPRRRRAGPPATAGRLVVSTWAASPPGRGPGTHQSLPSTSPPSGVVAANQVVGLVPSRTPLALPSPSSTCVTPLLKPCGIEPSHLLFAGRAMGDLPATAVNCGVE